MASFDEFVVTSWFDPGTTFALWYWSVGLVVLAVVWWSVFLYKSISGPFLLSRFFILRLLLLWRGWQSVQAPGRSHVRAFMSCLSILGGKNPSLWSFQKALPCLPVPSLQHTCSKYLESVEPLLTKEEFERTKQHVEEFQKGTGKKLQAYLKLRSWDPRVTNWMEQWWEHFAYCCQRAPLVCSSNYYMSDRADLPPLTSNPAARAAFLIHEALAFKTLIEKEQLQPLRMGFIVPICMIGYSRLFGTTRVPGKDYDSICTVPSSKHIVVCRKSRFFKLNVLHHDGSSLSVSELQQQLDFIYKHADIEGPGVAALTCSNRTQWYENRRKLMEVDACNQKSVLAIEEALFAVVLDQRQPDDCNEMMRMLLHGQGFHYWCDKNFNLVIFDNARGGVHVEHTYADAPVVAHLWEYMTTREHLNAENYYTTGQLVSFPPQLPPPQELQWKLPEAMHGQIHLSACELSKIISKIAIRLLIFDDFGKGYVKKCKLSPDAFIQMAIQLAYYRLYQCCVLTYESASTRVFRHGRTETIRSCSKLSKKFVVAALDESVSKKDKITYLRQATIHHSALTREAMRGEGIDRHLLGLRIVAGGLGMDPPKIFTDKAYQFPYTLSTSQTPMKQHFVGRNSVTDAYPSIGGGFAPVAQPGFGVSYFVCGEDKFLFHISASIKESHGRTAEEECLRFEAALQTSLRDMHGLFQE